MDTNQPTTSSTIPVAAPSSGVFVTKIPSAVAFAIGVLLFFMPFVDIKCNNMKLQDVTGFELATGFQMKNGNTNNNSILNDLKSEDENAITKTSTKTDKKDPNLYAMVALGLGIIGLILAFVKTKAGTGLGMVTAILTAAAMIGLMIDIKKQVKLDMPGSSRTNSGDDFLGLNKLGQEVGDKMNISVDFTPWFYVSIIAFLAAAFFCYKRMQTTK